MNDNNRAGDKEVEDVASRRVKMLEVLRCYGACQYSLTSVPILTARLLLPIRSRDMNTRHARSCICAQSSACAMRRRPSRLGRYSCKYYLVRVPSSYGKSLLALGRFP